MLTERSAPSTALTSEKLNSLPQLKHHSVKVLAEWVSTWGYD